MSRIASILIPMPLPEAFDYEEPEGMALELGEHVAVPLGPRLLRGVVTGLRDGAGGNRPLKPVAGRLEGEPLPPGLLEFVQWAARYAVDVPGQPLAIALRGLRAPKPKPERRLRAAAGVALERPTPARLKVLEAAAQPLPGAELARIAGVSAGVVKGLVDLGALDEVWVTPDLTSRPPTSPGPARPSIPARRPPPRP